jgi:hypothetical protein
MSMNIHVSARLIMNFFELFILGQLIKNFFESVGPWVEEENKHSTKSNTIL